MKLFRFFLLPSLFVLIFVSLSCFKKPKGFGEDTQLFVIADSTNWLILEPAMREVFEKVISTPQPEKVFDVNWVSPDKFNQYATRKNLIIAGVLDAEGTIDKQVTGMLAADVRSKVVEGSAFVFPKKRQWAEKQLLLVLVSTTLGELQEKMLSNKDFLYRLFHEKLRDETFSEMYEKMEQTELAETILEKHGWTLRIQHDYFINTDRLQDRFVMLRRTFGTRERWLFVHWIEDADPNLIETGWAIRTRNKLTKKFYEGDRVDEKHVDSRDVEFLGRNALMLEGLWRNDDSVEGGGGPFRNYTFYDEASGRIYMIDAAVFYPGGKKEPFLRQLDIMAHTFETIHDRAQKKAEETG